jgi:hypothetical protein
MGTVRYEVLAAVTEDYHILGSDTMYCGRLRLDPEDHFSEMPRNL